MTATALPEIDAGAIRDQLERVLAAEIFLHAQRSRAFLRYAVERTLAGLPAKEYEIALEVLERSETYDPAVDATVRVEAGRLRGRLREYYATAGSTDLILIDIPKGGYGADFRLRSPADHEKPSAALPPPPFPEPPANEPVVDRWLAHQATWILLGVALLVAAPGLWLVHTRRVAAQPIHSLAVLPLENLSGNPAEQYFADGITDQIITELARIPTLRVVSRTSVMETRGKSLAELARQLQVDAVVEGTVARIDKRVRITAQLIDAREDRHLWSGSFEDQASDTLELQDRVAGQIATETRSVLSPDQRNTPKRQIDPDAYDAYLRGLFFLHQREASQSARYFEQAVSLQPDFAAAYAGLAEALDTEKLVEVPSPDALPRAEAAARRAVALDPRSGEAHTALAMIEIDDEKDWPGARRELDQAIALSPNYSLAEIYYSIYLDAMGRPEEAVQHMRRAVQLDPLSFYANRHLGSVLYFARHYDQSLIALHRALELQPAKTAFVALWQMRDEELTGRFAEAAQADALYLQAEFPQQNLAPLRLAYQKGGWQAYLRARLAVLLGSGQGGCDAYEEGETYLRLGDRDRAFSSLEQGVVQGCFWGDSLPVDPLLDRVRDDPRFAALLRRVSLRKGPV